MTRRSTSFYCRRCARFRVFPETVVRGWLTAGPASCCGSRPDTPGARVVGIGLGVAIGSSRVLRGLLEPVLEFFRAIPPPVLVPVLILFAGIGTSMKILVIFSGCVWPILLNTVEGVRGIDEVLRDTARCYRLRPATQLRFLVLRAASPQIAAGARAFRP